MIFQTIRLQIYKLKASDTDAFFDMMGNPKVMNPIPQEAMTHKQSDAKLAELLKYDNPKVQVWAIRFNDEFIGICGLLINDEGNPEVAYRLREAFWGEGFGTEIAKGLLDYGFGDLGFELITADVNITNIPSVKILEKFFIAVREFYNPKDKCTDRRYHLERKDYWYARNFACVSC